MKEEREGERGRRKSEGEGEELVSFLTTIVTLRLTYSVVEGNFKKNMRWFNGEIRLLILKTFNIHTSP